MILATPVNLPKIVPDDWGLFTRVWEENAKPLAKKTPTPNGMYGGKWVGFDIYRGSLFKANYEASWCQLSELYPKLFTDIMIATPPGTTGVRFVESRCPFPAHVDNHVATWQLRCMLFCENPEEQWHYTRLDGTDRRPLVLPEETNWFAYKDGALKHGTDYDPARPKILLQVFGVGPWFSALATEGAKYFDPKYQVDYA